MISSPAPSPAPSNYLVRLLGEATKYFRDNEVSQGLENCDPEIAQEIKDLALPSAKKTPDELADHIRKLADKLAVRPRFQERLAFAVNYSPSKWLLEWEQPYVKARREMHGLKAADPKGSDPYDWARDQQVQGICLSGGGIRSATFNLGVLQGLASLGLLKNFDYLSSVSGGGYIHEFLAAWIKREEEREQVEQTQGKKATPPRTYKHGDGLLAVQEQLDPLPNKDAAAFHPEPIKWLRRYSNYLTPAKGVFSADMWVAVAIWLRNTFLNQIVLLSGLLMLVLLARVVSLVLYNPVPVTWLAWIAASLFLVVAAYLGLALYREYFRIREDDLDQLQERSTTGVSGWKWPNKMRQGLLKPRWNWVSGEGAARALGVVPFLVAACFSLFTLSSGFPPDKALGAVLEVFACLVFTALVTTFAGGAWRGHSFLNGKKPYEMTPGGIWVCFYSAFLASVLGTLAFLGFCFLLDSVWFSLAPYRWQVIAVFGPPLLLSVPFLTLVFGAGLVGRDFPGWMREWLARVRAWSMMIGLFWILAFGIVLLGPFLVDWLASKSGGWFSTLKWSTVVAWVATSAGSLLAGKSGRSSGRKDDPQTSSMLDLLAAFGPYVYMVGLLVVLSWVALHLVTLTGDESYGSIAPIFAVSAVVFAIFGARVDINEFSLSTFYRNRLTRCYLGASNSDRQPSPLTGFDDRDTRGMQISRLLPMTPLAMMENHPEPDFIPYTGPFPIICTTLNLTFGEDLAWQERKAASFAFTPLYSGYTVGWTSGKRGDKLSFNGFVPTYNYGFPDGGINISTAVAISGAAASPNWGYHTNPAMAFLMTMFDVRLGWWICNPRKLSGLAGADPLVRHRKTDRPSPPFAPRQLAKELLGMTDDSSDYVYLSDGGHFDNMGLYELVRRRCYRILICDGEEDENYVFEGLGMSIRKCRIDFGVEITLSDLKELRLDAKTGYCPAHFATGTIRYPETGTDPSPKEGRILYLKSSLTGTASFTSPSGSEKKSLAGFLAWLGMRERRKLKLKPEPADILNYKLQHNKFPHDPTLNQWFTESQFESYRRLGCHVVEEVQSCGQWESFKPGQAQSTSQTFV